MLYKKVALAMHFVEVGEAHSGLHVNPGSIALPGTARTSQHRVVNFRKVHIPYPTDSAAPHSTGAKDNKPYYEVRGLACYQTSLQQAIQGCPCCSEWDSIIMLLLGRRFRQWA